MTIVSRAAGKIEIDERQIIEFPRGILGFEDHHQFALLDSAQPPFYWLQSLKDPETAFVLISPDVFRSDFSLSLVPGELGKIGVEEDGEGELYSSGDGEIADLLVFAIVTLGSEKDSMTANLQGPVIINPRQRLGMQGIQSDPLWRTKHHILQEMAEMEAR